MNKQIVVIGVLVILLFSSLAVWLGSGNVNGNVMKKIGNGGVKGYTTHDVIRINSNDDFANQASQGGWSGDGTQGNPYIISGYDIDAHGAGDAIYIGNTTSYFIVKNCYLYNASWYSWPYFGGAGITLYNTTHGIILNNSCEDNKYGIYLYNSYKNTILNNSLPFHVSDSILLAYSDNNTMVNNTCTFNQYAGISLDHSGYNSVYDNNCSYNNEYGILEYASSNNELYDNIIECNGYYGIKITNFASNNRIMTNTIFNNSYYGVYIESGDSNSIYKNIFSYNNGSNDTFNSSHIQAYDDGINNSWNTTTGIGNYWHDWANNNDTNDQNNDGIVDWPYKIDGSAGAKDYYPLRCPIGKSVPSAPYNLTANSGNGYVNLTWDKPICNGSSPITEYRIYRIGKFIASVPRNQLYYNDTNVVNGQTYTYYVTAVNSVGESDKSNEVQATIPTVPLAPQNLQASSGDEYVNLTWFPPADDGGSAIIEYKIYRDGKVIATVGNGHLYYNDTNVVNGKTYTYYVTAVNSIGESDKSNEVQVTPMAEGGNSGGNTEKNPNILGNIWMWIIIILIVIGIIAGILIERRRNPESLNREA